MELLVYRGAGDRQGEDIIDELLVDVQAAAARGNTAINESCSSRVVEAASSPSRDFIETGSLARVSEAEGWWPGQVTFWQETLSLDVDNGYFVADTGLRVERERNLGEEDAW